MDDATLKKLKPFLWIFAAILLGFMVFSCTRSVVNLARRNCHWGWWSWTPCFFNVYLLIEVILSKNKTALIAACALIAVNLLAVILFLFGYQVFFLWLYALLIPVGMIVLMYCEDNSFLKKLNLVTLVMILVGAFSAHL